MRIADIQNRSDLTLVDRDYDVDAIKGDLYLLPDFNDYLNLISIGGFFVKEENGEFTELYAYKGTIPSIEKEAYKIEIVDIIPGSPDWVKNFIYDIEVKKLETYLSENIKDIKTEFLELNDSGPFSFDLTHEYDPDNGYERIQITPNLINEYGVIEYLISMEIFGESDELPYPDSIIQDEIYNFNPPTEKKLNQIERNSNKKGSKWVLKKPVKLHDFGLDIEIKNVLLDRVCYNNITHYHYYMGKEIKATIRELENIGPLIQLRGLLYSLGD